MADSSGIHRLLDEAFADAPRSEAVQDLKEELRASLLRRVVELEADGIGADEAARQAFDELGDVSELIANTEGPQWGTPSEPEDPPRIEQKSTNAGCLLSTFVGLPLLIVGILMALKVVGGGPVLAAAFIATFVIIFSITGGLLTRHEHKGDDASSTAEGVSCGLTTGTFLLGVAAFALSRTGGPVQAWLVAGAVLMLAWLVSYVWYLRLSGKAKKEKQAEEE